MTLGTVEDDGLIRGYPDYSWHDNQGSNCDGMTSVFRVAVSKTFLSSKLSILKNKDNILIYNTVLEGEVLKYDRKKSKR